MGAKQLIAVLTGSVAAALLVAPVANAQILNIPKAKISTQVDTVVKSIRLSPKSVSRPTVSPKVRVVHVTSSTVTLRWQAVPGALRYQIYRDGRWWHSDRGTSITDRSLSQNTKYKYTVYAVSSRGWSKGYSLTAITLYNKVPDTPTHLRTEEVTSTTATVTWNGATRATEYTVMVDGRKVGTTRTTSYIIRNLTPNAAYTISLYAMNSRGSSPETSMRLRTAQAETASVSDSTLQVTTTSQSASPSGVTPGVISSGSAVESWYQTSPTVSLQNSTWNANSNLLPIVGTVTTTQRQDLVIAIYNSSENEQWLYSIPVQPDGQFSDTIELPYHGVDDISIGFPQDAPGSDFTLLPADSLQVVNSQPDLSATSQALLQSWMVNYNESSTVLAKAQQITQSAVSTDSKIEAVSNWVSNNVWYNFTELNDNLIEWKQATQTIQDGNGVCQDEAAASAALLRSLGIPTRVVDGEAYDPESGQDLGGHAWDEAWDGTAWITFDPTWDQVYYQSDYTAAPVTITDDWFASNPVTFAQTHVEDASLPYAWEIYIPRD